MILLQVIKVLILAVLGFLVAFALTFPIERLLIRFNARKHIRDTGQTPVYTALHAKKAGTPTMGGVIIWGTVVGVAIIIAILNLLFDGIFGYLNFIDRAQTYLPLTAMLIAGLLGLLDDILGTLKIGAGHGGGIAVRHKLIAYLFMGVLGALWFYYRLDWNVLTVPFFGTLSIGWLYIPLFLFIIVASAFSANETDGLDGLAGGVMLFGFIALTIVAFVLGRFELAAFGGVTIGALLAFLWFNIYPARFFMGDTGSMSLGITLGMVAMLTNTTLLLPFFVSIFVIESGSVLLQMISKRLRGGRKIFRSTPIHHHFESLGWPETQVTMRFWIVSAMLSVLGLVIFFLDHYLPQ